MSENPFTSSGSSDQPAAPRWREPPVDIEVEQALLGALLIKNAAFHSVQPFLHHEHFANALHGRIYQAIGKAITAGEGAEPILVKATILEDPKLVPIEGAGEYVAKLINAAGPPHNAPHYGRLIVRSAQLRAEAELRQQIVEAASSGAPIAEIIRLARQVEQVEHGPPDPLIQDKLKQAFGLQAWSELDVPPETKLLGDLITPTTRLFLVGRTGLGKTLLAHAMCAGMGRGEGFCHWRSERPSRWLIFDGEMPSVLLKQRAQDVLRRGGPIPDDNVMVYSLDRAEEFARMFPGLGMPAPLNTEEGRAFVLRLVEMLKPDGVCFDNIMSLVDGDQKDEVPWSAALPLVTELTRRQVAQIWLDHAGHNADRQYGSSTKQWRMDAVGILTPLGSEQDKDRGETAFNLSFEAPSGKARRRNAENADDFADVVIRLRDDEWSSETLDGKGSVRKLSPAGRDWYRSLLDALVATKTPGKTTRYAWYAEAVRVAIADAINQEDSHALKERKRMRHRKYIAELLRLGLIGVDGDIVTLVTKNV